MSYKKNNLTVIIPAYNEAGSISDTIKSLQTQTCKPDHIIVIDDCSTDDTGKIAKKLGATVIRPKKNTGTKAGAQNYALKQVKTQYVMALDADTVIAKDGIHKLLEAIKKNKKLAAVCGFVIPRFIRTIWERGRYIEYLFAFSFYKPVQDYFKKPLIASGCFSLYRTQILKEQGGWSTRTMAEDMDLTWSFYRKNYLVAFIPEAVCFPIEPENFSFMSKQLKRWSHGFVQNVMLHWKDILAIPYLRLVVGISIWDAAIASVIFTILIPLLALILNQPLFFLAYFIDAPVTFIPIALEGIRRKELFKTIASFPSFFILRMVNSLFMIEALISELLFRKRLTVYEKGH